jgi:CubicO group peptidase (beta-lactamase class C family)
MHRQLGSLRSVLIGSALTAVILLISTTLPGQDLKPQPRAAQAPGSAKSGPAQEPGSHELTQADLEAFLDGFVPFALKSGDMAGMVISVVKDGQVLLQKGYGYANVKNKQPMNPELTLIRPGSTSKLFTWTAVMQLVEEGKIDLDRDINDYLDFRITSKFQKPITMRDLMTHRAGFEEGLKTILLTDPGKFISTEKYLKEHQRPVMYPPGQVPAYSNYGAALAGYIVQRVSGEPFESYVERHIFAPLGMTRSTFRQPLPAQLAPDMSQGYMSASEPPRAFEGIITAPAGSMSTTADDMSKFMIAYLQQGEYKGNRILKPETVRQMFQPAVPTVDDLNVMGLGFFEENRNGRTIRGHGGDTIVFHTSLDLFPDAGVGIFFSFNSRGQGSAVYAARQQLFDGFADRYFPSRTQQPANSVVPPADAKDHAQQIAGRYQSSRRVESGFISVLYLLSQTVITANDDGTINVPTFPDNRPKRYGETAPYVWTEEGGQNKVALSGQGDARTVYSKEDPSSVLQPVPGWKSSRLNLTILCVSIVILLVVAIGWPVSGYLQKKYQVQTTASPRGLLAKKILRFAAVIDLIYVIGWIFAVAPILSNQIETYSDSFDPYLRLLQVAGLLVIAAAVAGIWAAAQKATGWKTVLWNLVTACALVGILWVAIVAKLISFNLNY